MSRTGFVLAATLLLAAPAAFAQQAPAPAQGTVERLGPREAVSGIAEVIETHYWDPAKGKAVADELRVAAARGEFDRLTDPRELLVALNARLKPKDAHFNVGWSPAAAPPPRAAGPEQAGPPPEYLAELRRRNYGVVAVRQLPGNIGLLDLRQFADIDFGDANDPARRAMDAALLLMSGSDAVIIDLRDNGGGSPAMVGYLTSAFTPKDADIYNTFHSREGTESEAPGIPHPTPNLTAPVYILTSARTGSAAEAFAYTMQMARRAIVVGEASAGAANPAGLFPARGGFVVVVSTGSPTNPISRRNWEGTGVTPDVSASFDNALDRAQALALAEAMKSASGPYRVENQWALDALSPPAIAYSAADYVGEYNGRSIEAEAGGIRYVRGRRPAWSLYPVAADTFAIRGDPSRRVHFIRENGKVVALEVHSPTGPGGLYRRGG